jgi:predicted nucleic acid-binding protein
MIKAVFVDTAFWISLFDPTDQKHPLAAEKISELERNPLVTTDAVLTNEFLLENQSIFQNKSDRFCEGHHAE